MSLLTDEEIKDLTATWHVQHTTPQYRLVADASQTKTLKAVAEWGQAECYNGLHSEENILQVRRMECPDCRDELLREASEGKMPGEET